MDSEGHNSQGVRTAPKRPGALCLPSPYRAPSAAADKLLGGHPNPFPLIEDVQRAHTLLPIASFWFPVPEGEEFLPLLHAIFSHETVHLILGESVGPFLANCLVQGQYLTIMEELAHQERPRRWLALPSLSEPTGCFLKAQDALDAVGREMEFIHELMATTLVRFLFHHDLMLVAIPVMRQTQRFARAAGFEHLTGATDYEDESLKDQLALVSIGRNSAEAADYILPLDDASALAYYQDHFAGEGDFVAMHDRLLEAWQRVAANLRPEGDEESILLMRLLRRLVKYPFDLALSDDLFAMLTLTRAYRETLGPMAAFVGQLKGRFHARTELMLGAIEAGALTASAAEWQRHLSGILPLFDREFHGWQSLASFAHVIWGEDTNAARVFAHRFLEPYEMWWFNHAPLINDLTIGKWPPPKDHAERQHRINTLNGVLGLESMRQAILAGEGPACLCAPDFRELCWMRTFFARLWFSSYPDPGWEESFREYWRRPECL